MCFLKRALPFAATLLLGLILGSFAIGRLQQPAQTGFFSTSQSNTFHGYGCRAHKHNLVYHSYSSSLQILNKPEAQYTDAARLAGIEGTVQLRAVFDSDGVIKDVRPITRLPFGLTDSAMRAAFGVEFVPEAINGVNVPVERLLEYRFELH
ncbi:MAG: energy transducer TonB [Pyrinomonadaceae bacterium]|nr:energy transducer TonB [Pyrinomonadaceae bacterium]